MDFPSQHLSVVTAHGVKESAEGWLVLDLRTVDIDGVTKLYINLDEVEAAKQKKSASQAEADRLRKLLGG